MQHTAASALPISVPLGLVEWVAAVIVAYICTGTSQETQPDMAVLAMAIKCHGLGCPCRLLWTVYPVHGCTQPQRGDTCSELANPMPHQPVTGGGEEKHTVFHCQYELSEGVVLVLHGRCIPIHDHIKYVAPPDPTSEGWHPKTKICY